MAGSDVITSLLCRRLFTAWDISSPPRRSPGLSTASSALALLRTAWVNLDLHLGGGGHRYRIADVAHAKWMRRGGEPDVS